MVIGFDVFDSDSTYFEQVVFVAGKGVPWQSRDVVVEGLRVDGCPAQRLCLQWLAEHGRARVTGLDPAGAEEPLPTVDDDGSVPDACGHKWF